MGPRAFGPVESEEVLSLPRLHRLVTSKIILLSSTALQQQRRSGTKGLGGPWVLPLIQQASPGTAEAWEDHPLQGGAAATKAPGTLHQGLLTMLPTTFQIIPSPTVAPLPCTRQQQVPQVSWRVPGSIWSLLLLSESLKHRQHHPSLQFRPSSLGHSLISALCSLVFVFTEYCPSECDLYFSSAI